MYRIYYLLLLILYSCQQHAKPATPKENITGNWIIIFPKQDEEDIRGRAEFSKIQDSILALTCLKLVSFKPGGIFQQIDSPAHRGQWDLSPENLLYIQHGGKEFDHFEAGYTDFTNNVMTLRQQLQMSEGSIQLNWELRKVQENDSASELFEKEMNAWRMHPAFPESGEAIKNRVVMMLDFYARYFKLVDATASFFVTGRIFLPLRFYQHGIGMKDFSAAGNFEQMFYDSLDAKKAYEVLHSCFRAERFYYPKGKNFVNEYALFLNEMAAFLRKP